MRVELEADGDHSCYITANEFFNVFGGEYYEGDYHHDEYGVQFDNLSIYGIPSNQMKLAALQIINHLMTNGHDFIIDKDFNGPYIKSIN